LGSTNGTWVNGQPISPGTDVVLAVGDELAIGDRNSAWRFEDDSPPQPMAAPMSGGEACVLADGVIAIPNAQSPAASIFRGADGNWTLESADRVTPIQAGGVLEAMGRAWRFSCPNEWEATTKTRHVRVVQESTLYFDVSSDGDDVKVSAEYDGERIAMGNLSSYYLLYTLARLRNEERELHSASESGWVHREDLMNKLRCGEPQINVWIHRIRSRFSRENFLDYASVIERRDGTGQLRIGVQHNVICVGGSR
jgi:hypothetical protein